MYYNNLRSLVPLRFLDFRLDYTKNFHLLLLENYPQYKEPPPKPQA